MLANGHPEAPHYPLGLVFEEVGLVRKRQNQATVTEATLLQMAVSSVLSAEAGREFRKMVDRLSED